MGFFEFVFLGLIIYVWSTVFVLKFRETRRLNRIGKLKLDKNLTKYLKSLREGGSRLDYYNKKRNIIDG